MPYRCHLAAAFRLSDHLTQAYNLAVAATTIICVVAAGLILFPKFRARFPDLIMSCVRGLALAIGWLFVAVLYLPIQLFNVLAPHEVPYLRHLRETEKEKAVRPLLPVNKAGSYHLFERYAAVFEDDEV